MKVGSLYISTLSAHVVPKVELIVSVFNQLFLVAAMLFSFGALAKPQVGDAAPGFDLQALNGDRIVMARLKEGGRGDEHFTSHSVGLIFLDSLCPMPQFPECEQKLVVIKQEMARNSSTQWVGVMNSYYVDENFATQFLDKHDLTLPVIFDKGNVLFAAYGVFATPYVIIVNPHGLIKSRAEVAL